MEIKYSITNYFEKNNLFKDNRSDGIIIKNEKPAGRFERFHHVRGREVRRDDAGVGATDADQR